MGRSSVMRAALVFASVAGLFAACKGNPCPELALRRSECAPVGFDPALFTEACDATQTRDDDGARALARCLELTECDAAQQCVRAANDTTAEQRAIAQIAQAIGGRDIEAMKDACHFVGSDQEQLLGACAPAFVLLLEAATAEVTALRDAATPDIGVCDELLEFADHVGGEAPDTAKQLCAQAEDSAAVAQALELANANVAAKEPAIPPQCQTVLTLLSAGKSAWHKARTDAVVKACYQTLGLVVLEAKVPAMKPTPTQACDAGVQEVFDAVTTLKIRDPKLDPWLEKIQPLCGTQTP